MIFAKAVVTLGTHKFHATLDADGWHSATPEIESSLNSVADISRFGPADGDPIALAAEAAREAFGAEVEVLVSHPDATGRIY